MSVTIKDGDYIVTRGQWRLECVQATRTTKQTVFFMDSSWGKPRERRVSIESVLFAGSEGVAKRLLQQLESSYQQKIQDQQKASERQRERDEKFIAAALSLPSDHRA